MSTANDMSMVTAARLSATFPFVTPVSRPADGRTEGFHIADSGYWDNSGLFSALEWLEHAKPAGHPNVLLIEIRSSPPKHQVPPENAAWTLDLTGPLRTTINVREAAQLVRNRLERNVFIRSWPKPGAITCAAFTLDEADVSLSWKLGRADIQRIEQAWNKPRNQEALRAVGQFFNQPFSNCDVP